MTMSQSALVIIDLQNEFLSENGSFLVLESSATIMFQNLSVLVPAFRIFGRVIWVQSFYGNGPEIGEYNDRLSGTHTSKTPCCEEGTWNSQLCPSALALKGENDSLIVKRNYSAFKDTELLQELQTSNTSDVFFCGLLSNTCVLATIIDAVQIPGLRVHAVRDCLAYRKERSHEKALARMHDLLVNVVTSQEISQGPQGVITAFSTPVLYYVNSSIPSWRVQVALYEKGIKVKQVRMKVMTDPKPTRLPAFLSLNHRGKTPVFVDTDPAQTTVNESIAILLYLETYYTETPLLPPVDQRGYRARVLSLIQETENLHHAYDALEDGFFDAQNNGILPDFVATKRPGLIEDLYKELDFWETYASRSSRYIAGMEDFTLADCAFYPLLGYMLRRGFQFNERWTGLQKYHEVVWTRQSAQAAQPIGEGKLNVFTGS